MNEDLQLYGYIIDKHTYGGWSVSVQTTAQGIIDTMSTFDRDEIDVWLEENYPQAIEIFVQV